MEKNRNRQVIVWFRQDLRLHDNEALLDALSVADYVIPVYVFDPRVFKAKTPYGFYKTGQLRAQFMIESVQNLRANLQALGSDLIVRVGFPEDEVFRIAKQARTSWVFCNRERTREEVAVQDALEKNLWSIGQEVRFSRGKMLYYTADLPFPVTACPDAFATFRKEVERIVKIRKPLPTPNRLLPPRSDIHPGNIPVLSDFYPERDDVSFGEIAHGGESEAIFALEKFLTRPDDGESQSKEGFSLQGDKDHSLMSAYLSSGCISPKKIYHSLVEDIRYKSVQRHIRQNLIYRDYLRLMGKKYGCRIFSERGINNTGEPQETSVDIFRLWAHGHTGVPIIDAVMRKLYRTGYISARARELAARFFIEIMEGDWRMGASWYESRLLDYDPCSNWVNWNIMAGLGPDSKEFKPLNVLAHARRLDPHGAFIKHWLPELAQLDATYVHEPQRAGEEVLENSEIFLGKNYPMPIV